MSYKYNVGLDSVTRVKLLMSYSLSKTLTENEESVLTEQSKNENTPKYISDLQKKDYQSKHPDEVWDPNVTQKQQYLDRQGNTITKNIKVGGFVPLTPENMGLRGTPFGFHPEEYPEYLKKVAEIKKKVYNSTNWFEDNTDNRRNQELAKLKSQYYHAEFPSGIKKQDYLDWVNGKKQLSAQQRIEFDNSRKLFSGSYKTPKDMPNSDYFLNVQNQNVKNAELYRQSQIRTDYKSMNDYMDAIYEYDPYSIKEINKSALDKWWDEYGPLAEFALWFLADLATDGAVAYLTGPRQALVLAKVVKFAGKIGLPIAVGTYDTIKNGHLTETGIMDFMFAFFPWAHAKFGIKSTPSIQLVESIVSKQAGLNLRLPQDVRKYVKLLTQEEKSFFREVTKLTQSQKKNGIKWVIDELNKKGLGEVLSTANKVKRNTKDFILRPKGELIKPSKLVNAGKFGLTIAKDLTGIEIAKVLAGKLGLLNSEEKVKKLADEFNKRKGTELLILIANAIKVIKKYPYLDADSIIKKSLEQHYAKTDKESLDIIKGDKDTFNAFLRDKNGNPVKR
jgi:hypothetical protein